MSTVNIFISYASEDAIHRDCCLKQLRKSQNPPLDVFCDTEQIGPGDHIPGVIARAISKADIAILLLSRHYFERAQSPERNWRRDEWEQIKVRRIHVIPVLLEFCNWENVLPDLEKHKFFPGPGTDVAMPTDVAGVDEAWYALAQHIRTKARELMPPQRPPDLDRVLERHSSHNLNDPDEFLGLAVKSGTITPVLGPGCHAVRENRQRGLKRVKARRDGLVQALAVADDIDDEELKHCENYLRALIADSLGDQLDIEGPARGRTRQSLDEPAEPLLVELLVHLVRGSVMAMRLFGRAMQKNVHGLTDASRYTLPVEPTAEEAVQLCRFLAAATEAAGDVVAADRATTDGDGHKGLGAKGLGARRIERHLAALTQRFKTHGSVTGRLSLDDLEWLGDLFWHLLRFDAPMYPSAEELGFQLAVCQEPDGPARRAPASAVALAMTHDENYVDRIHEWFTAYAPPDRWTPPAASFYDNLAAALARRAPVTPAQPPARTVRRPTAEVGDEAREFVPIAISCNFDQELERAFRRSMRVFHVGFPVHCTDEHDVSIPGWLLRIVRPATAWCPADDRLLGANFNADDLMDLRASFRGPLLVKLHGSPLEPLPKQEDLGRFSVRLGASASARARLVKVVHRLVLSDYQILEDALSGQTLLPPGLDKLLRAGGGRMLCFFGFPLRDPNSRLRIYMQHALSSAQGALLQEHPEDPLRSRFAKRMGANVHYYPRSLDDVAERMYEANASMPVL